jgi:hypothetical protein
MTPHYVFKGFKRASFDGLAFSSSACRQHRNIDQRGEEQSNSNYKGEERLIRYSISGEAHYAAEAEKEGFNPGYHPPWLSLLRNLAQSFDVGILESSMGDLGFSLSSKYKDKGHKLVNSLRKVLRNL